ncbi:MAG: hypothetical protein C0456_07370 [Hyphomonas sp.]|uniref:hypothetical protein n=1 Tax=Hyphomonas sp. TaxID=87 RepID=UPI001DB275AB|nr:hypothetical protein [Hyphomonas sp.]MBA4226437.1 hypothetical protein [Hyphomonas sp.]
MLNYAIRKSESALGRILLLVALSTIAMLGLVWLSIAVWGWFALIVAQPLAAAITGGVFICISLLGYLVSRSMTARPEAKNEASDTEKMTGSDDVVARGMRIAERMAPDSPMAALLVALLSGLGSVSLPAALSPFLIKIMDDAERLPGSRTTN